VGSSRAFNRTPYKTPIPVACCLEDHRKEAFSVVELLGVSRVSVQRLVDLHSQPINGANTIVDPASVALPEGTRNLVTLNRISKLFGRQHLSVLCNTQTVKLQNEQQLDAIHTSISDGARTHALRLQYAQPQNIPCAEHTGYHCIEDLVDYPVHRCGAYTVSHGYVEVATARKVP